MGRREVIIITSFTIRVQENVDEVAQPDHEKKEEGRNLNLLHFTIW